MTDFRVVAHDFKWRKSSRDYGSAVKAGALIAIQVPTEHSAQVEMMQGPTFDGPQLNVSVTQSYSPELARPGEPTSASPISVATRLVFSKRSTSAHLRRAVIDVSGVYVWK